MRRLVPILAFAAAFILLAACNGLEGGIKRELQGSWRPVYAVGEYEDAVYHISYDGALDENGQITGLAVSKNNPDVRYDQNILFPGKKFFRKDGEDLFLSFFLNQSSSDIQPLQYYVEGNKIHFELTNGTFVNCDPGYLQSGSGKFSEGVEFTFVDDNTLRIGGVTYARMR